MSSVAVVISKITIRTGILMVRWQAKKLGKITLENTNEKIE